MLTPKLHTYDDIQYAGRLSSPKPRLASHGDGADSRAIRRHEKTCWRSVPVVLGLVRALFRNVEVRGLAIRQHLELDAELGEVQARDLLVELLRQRVHAAALVAGDAGQRGLALRRKPQVDLRDGLVGERVAHHEARVARGAA